MTTTCVPSSRDHEAGPAPTVLAQVEHSRLEKPDGSDFARRTSLVYWETRSIPPGAHRGGPGPGKVRVE